MSTPRQTGITTQQMIEAPKGAIYVWVNDMLDYPKRLAEHLGRGDLLIKSPRSVRLQTVAGRRIGIVVDHATKWTQGISEAWDHLMDAPTLTPDFTLDAPGAFHELNRSAVGAHQSQLPPALNKFHKGKGTGRHIAAFILLPDDSDQPTNPAE